MGIEIEVWDEGLIMLRFPMAVCSKKQFTIWNSKTK